MVADSAAPSSEQDVLESLAEHIYYALRRDDWGVANDGEREEVLDVAVAVRKWAVSRDQARQEADLTAVAQLLLAQENPDVWEWLWAERPKVRELFLVRAKAILALLEKAHEPQPASDGEREALYRAIHPEVSVPAGSARNDDPNLYVTIQHSTSGCSQGDHSGVEFYGAAGCPECGFNPGPVSAVVETMVKRLGFGFDPSLVDVTWDEAGLWYAYRTGPPALELGGTVFYVEPQTLRVAEVSASLPPSEQIVEARRLFSEV